MMGTGRFSDESVARFWLGIFSLLVVYLGLFFRLGTLPLVGADEPRYARISEEMADSGDWVTPRLLDRPWLEKPPLLFWMQAGMFRLLGVGEAQARLPVALAAVLASLALAFLLARIAGSAAGFLVFLILQTSVLYVLFGRSGSTDMPLTAFLTAALVFAYLAQHERSHWWSLAAGGALGVAVLAKGPVALLLFGAILFGWCFLVDRIPWSLGQVSLGGAALLATAVPWFWQVWLANGENFVLTFWVNHHLARYATDLHHHSQPVWFYVPILIAGCFPWVFFLWSSARSTWRMRRETDDPERNLKFLLWLWALIPLGFFSLSGSKLAGYILPSVPPIAALAALEWQKIHQRDLGVYRPMRTQLALVAACAVLLAFVLTFGFHFRYRSLETGVLVSIPLLATVLWGRIEYTRRRPGSLFMLLAGGLTVTLAMLYVAAGPIVARYHSTRDLSLRATPLISGDQPLVLYRFFHHSAQYYTAYRTTPLGLSGSDDLKAYLALRPQSRYIVLTKENGKVELELLGRVSLIEEAGDLYLLEFAPEPQAAPGEDARPDDQGLPPSAAAHPSGARLEAGPETR
jgi:4-amino-4-deoxy-L-arabinose transferase-like glycosyltransferase